MKFFRKSLSNQLLAGFLFLSIVPPVIIGIISYSSGRQSIIKNVQAHLESVAILKKNAIKEWADRLQYTISWVAQEPFVIKNAFTLINTRASQQDNINAYHFLANEFRRFVSLDHFSQVFLLDKLSGQVIVASDPSLEGKIRKDELFFGNGKKGFYLSDILLSSSLEKPTMIISGPLKDSHGNLLGVIAAHADLTELNQIMMKRADLTENTESFLVNKSNFLITNTVFAPKGAFRKLIFGEGAKRAIKEQSGVDIFLDYRGVKVIGAYLWLEDRKLALIVKQDVSEAFASVAKLGTTILAIVIIVSMLAFFLSFLYASRITESFQRLIEGAKAIGQGNLDYRVASFAENEIGVLSNAFDDMAENLKVLSISRDEKEVLLREIHHRVKNNMQVIISLLSL